MKRPPFLLLALLGAISCAGPSATPSLITSPATAAQTIREVFDPRTLGEDLLLIQPTFQRASLQQSTTAPTVEPASEFATAAAVEPIAESAIPPAGDILTDLPIEYGPVDVFRLQLVTLSNEAIARKHQSELEQLLGTTVYLVARGEHFLLQAGQYATRKEAAQLKTRAAALGPDYADAYVVSTTIEAPLDTSPSDLAEDAPPIDTAATIELARIFGWRVLIDQFLSHDEAERLKLRAIKRLRRQDIDVTFKTPWYKVEVGNYRTEAQAQVAAERIEAYYPNALKVRSQILVPRGEN